MAVAVNKLTIEGTYPDYTVIVEFDTGYGNAVLTFKETATGSSTISGMHPQHTANHHLVEIVESAREKIRQLGADIAKNFDKYGSLK